MHGLGYLGTNYADQTALESANSPAFAQVKGICPIRVIPQILSTTLCKNHSSPWLNLLGSVYLFSALCQATCLVPGIQRELSQF